MRSDFSLDYNFYFSECQISVSKKYTDAPEFLVSQAHVYAVGKPRTTSQSY